MLDDIYVIPIYINLYFEDLNNKKRKMSNHTHKIQVT